MQYDFGPPPPAGEPAVRIPFPIVVHSPDAPLWMDGAAIHYRLAYEDPARVHSYAYNRWISSPMRLLGDLLRRKVGSAGVADGGMDGESPPEFVFETHVEEFTQVFDSRQSSHAVVRARVVLSRHGERQIAAQETFTVEQPAPTADAPGAVEALASASRTLAERIVEWVAQTAATLAKEAPPKTS